MIYLYFPIKDRLFWENDHVFTFKIIKDFTCHVEVNSLYVLGSYTLTQDCIHSVKIVFCDKIAYFTILNSLIHNHNPFFYFQLCSLFSVRSVFLTEVDYHQHQWNFPTVNCRKSKYSNYIYAVFLISISFCLFVSNIHLFSI